jgi:hypothetical protein
MEGLDQASGGPGAGLAGYMARLDAPTAAHFDSELLEGLMILDHPGAIVRPTTDHGLYFRTTESDRLVEAPSSIKLIPYYAWANRAASIMQVWIPYTGS